VFSIIGIIIAAFIQGRSISIWPPNIGSLPTAITQSAIIGDQLPTTTPADLLEVDEIPGEVISFDSREKGLMGSGQLIVLRNNDGTKDYKLDYNIPSQGDGYAGIYFSFVPTIDLTQYTNVEVLIGFPGDSAKCDIYVQDQNQVQSYIRLTREGTKDTGRNVVFKAEGDKYLFSIPITDNFTDVPVKKESLAGIGFSANATFIRGAHSCVIYQTALVK
jgi:hypothetical protein